MTEREKFEGAMLAEVIMPRPHLAAHIETIFERHEFGNCGYKQMWLDSAWIGWQAARATPASTFGTELSARIDAMLNKVFICANNEQQKSFNRMIVLLADCKAALTISATPAPIDIEHFGEVTVGDSFDGHPDDENCGSIHTAGINVGKWGNRIEIYGAGKNAADEAEVLRDIILSALGRVMK